jgi:hypothetical protein
MAKQGPNWSTMTSLRLTHQRLSTFLLTNFAMFYKHLTIVVLCLLGGQSVVAAEVYKEVTTEEAGTLASLISADEKFEITHLKINGPINGTDWLTVQEMMGYKYVYTGSSSNGTYHYDQTDGKMTILDMSDAQMVAGGDHYCCGDGGYPVEYTKDNTITNGMFAFSFLDINYSIETVILPNSCTTIDNDAFRECTLKHVSIGSSVTEIKSQAFLRCKKLETIENWNNVKSIGYSTFGGCSALKSITFGEALETINSNAFGSCTSLQYVDMTDGADLTISSNAFSYCTLKAIVINNRVKSIGDTAFPHVENVISLCASVPNVSKTAFGSTTDIKSVKGYCPYNVNSSYYWYPTGWNYFGSYGLTYSITTQYDLSQGSIEFSDNVIQHHTSPDAITYYSIGDDSVSFTVSASDGYYLTSLTALGTENALPAFEKDFNDELKSADTFSLGILSNNIVINAGFETEVYYDIPRQERLYGDENKLYYTKRTGQNEPEIIYDYDELLVTSANRESWVGEYTISFSPDFDFAPNEKHAESGTLVINNAPLLVSSEEYTRQYGEDNPTIEFTYSGFKAHDTAKAYEITPRISNMPDKYANVGRYYINVEIDEVPNYNVTIEKCPIINIIPADQTISWDQDFSDVHIGDEIALTATASSGLEITYASSDSDIAEIEVGKLILKGVGNVTITASQAGEYNFNPASLSRSITVNPILIASISLDNANITLSEGSSYQINATILPENATNKELIWQSTNEDVAVVNNLGLVSAIKEGKANIIAVGADGSNAVAYCQVSVFGSSNVDSISALGDYVLSVVNGSLVIDGLNDGQFIYVIGIDGRTIYYGIERTIPLNAGIYIVKIGTKTYKVSI